MKKYFLAIVIIAMLFSFAACSSDDNAVEVENEEVVDPEVDDPEIVDPEDPEEPEEPEEVNILHGVWVPNSAQVSVIGLLDMEEEYPHKDGCDNDNLEIQSELSTFTFHDEDCEKNEFSEAYIIDGDLITLNLMGYEVSLTIVENSEETLVLGGNGSDFEELIPLLLPEEYLESIPEGLLHLVNVKLSFDKEEAN